MPNKKQDISATSENRFVTILDSFSNETRLYYAAEAFLKDGFGIIMRSNNPNSTYNDYFVNNEADFRYVREALTKIEAIFPMGNVSQETLKGKRTKKADGSEPAQRYDTIKVFVCEARDGLSRDDIASLTKAFNRISRRTDAVNQTKNRPVIVLIRHGRCLSLSTCERMAKTDVSDTIGKVIILHNIDCMNPRLGHLQILDGMAEGINSCQTFDELFGKLIKSLSIDIVSDNFFKGYTSLFKEIVKYAASNREIKEEFKRFPDREKAIRDYVKMLMGRIVFIQFLQRKGWMGVPAEDGHWTDGDPEFLQNLFLRSDKKASFIEDVLRPLFQDLNTKRDNDLANECLGENMKIPYLNGGLFEDDEMSKVRFSLPVDMMGRMLEFFRSNNFTIDENAQDAVEVGVDPEMLSRIFESLLEDNKEKGAFYTPKTIVDYMCHEALITYLQEGTDGGSENSVYRDFVLNHEAEKLSQDDLAYVDNKLRRVKICDPAIGSGAFPMGMLKELFECRKAIEMHKNGGVFNPSEIKKDIIQNSIYGVDIEKGAVDIARLRFWLSLIIDEETPDALPNMDFKIMQGNSLLEQYEDVDLANIELSERQTRKRKGKKGQAEQLSLVFDEEDALKNIQVAIRRYYTTDHHETKISLRESINKNVKDYILHSKDCTRDIQRKLKSLAFPNDQFFLWHIYFKEVFDEGGFDIVIGNPPYIELQKMKEMSRVYKNCGFDTYNKSADIYCLFTEQGMNLLKEGGTLCYIMMNKWMKAEYGQQLRKYLLGKKIHRIIDFGDVQVFKNAITYPCIILVGNSSPGVSFKACRLKEFDMDSVDSLTDDFPVAEFDEDRWVISSRREQLLFKKLRHAFPTLKDYLPQPAKYGIKPGLSEAFLVSEETKRRLIAECDSAQEVIVPFLSGKDIKPYERPVAAKYLILFRKGDTLRLMGRGQTTEVEAWNFILGRYPSVCRWLQQFEEKARKRSDMGDFWWELRACDYYGQFAEPKIMYQTFQVKPNFIYDTEGCFCNNSMWIIPTEDKALLGLLNSKIGWWLTSNFCSQIQNGYQLIWEYFSKIPVALKKQGNDEIAALVDRILAARNADSCADITGFASEIDCRLYELYGLTNAEVKVIDPDMPTFGADFEQYCRKPDFRVMPEAELDRIFAELKARFDALSRALDNEEKEMMGVYDLSSDTKPSKEEVEDAFVKWNCAILTAFRGEKVLIQRNKKRNEELKAAMRRQGMLFRPVDGYYVEYHEEDAGTRRVPVNEFSFFVTNTDRYGDTQTNDEKKKSFFKRIYRLSEHYEQDGFLFTFPGVNRVAFLVATNKYGRTDYRNDIKFAGPLYTDVKDLDMWTGCSEDGKIAFMLKGLVQKKVPNSKVWIGEGDVFDVESYKPDCVAVIHDRRNKGLNDGRSEYIADHDNMYEAVFEEETPSAECVRTKVLGVLDALPRRMKTIGFHCSAAVEGSYVEGARAAYNAVLEWAEKNKNRLTKIVIVDVFGDYFKIQHE